MEDQELEVKFYVANFESLRLRLLELGAQEVQARTHEMNLRFDTPEGELTHKMQVLRLRQDTAARMTYKGPSESKDGVRVRQEIEFTVSDFHAARRLLGELGFFVAMIYEKYRQVYDLDGVSVTLDEMPYGDFLEIEGPDTESIRGVNNLLGLDWDARIMESYVVLFNRINKELDLGFRDLIFENFAGVDVSLEALNLKPADL